MQNIHASCIFYNGKGILITGKSGSGKSDLCLRMIMQKKAMLVADDRVDLYVVGENLIAKCPKPIEGLLEVRHLGIKKFPFISDIRIDFMISLVDTLENLERMPEPDFFIFEEINIPKYKLHGLENSIIDKLELLSY